MNRLFKSEDNSSPKPKFVVPGGNPADKPVEGVELSHEGNYTTIAADGATPQGKAMASVIIGNSVREGCMESLAYFVSDLVDRELLTDAQAMEAGDPFFDYDKHHPLSVKIIQEGLKKATRAIVEGNKGNFKGREALMVTPQQMKKTAQGVFDDLFKENRQEMIALLQGKLPIPEGWTDPLVQVESPSDEKSVRDAHALLKKIAKDNNLDLNGSSEPKCDGE